MSIIQHARATAYKQLRPQPQRLAHVSGVAAKANQATPLFRPSDARILVAAAWLHDIGYAPTITATGFHPLDGARWLTGRGWPALLCSLVAHHTGARFEAAERGLALSWPAPPKQLLAALTWADATTSHTGQPCTLDDRIRDIKSRYPQDDPVHRAIIQSEPLIRDQAGMIAAQLNRGNLDTARTSPCR